MVLLDLQSGTYFGLNPVGAEVWNQLNQRKTLDQIQQHLLTRYRVSPERCRSEVFTLVSTLVERGLVLSGSDDSHS